MGVTEGDLLQVIDHQTYLGQEIENVYFYRATLGLAAHVTPYTIMQTQFSAQVMGPVRNMQASLLTHTGVEIRNLSNGLDINNNTFTAVGGVTATAATCMPSAVTQGFKLVRESLATRNGQKRISGLIDTLCDGNVFNFPSPAVKTALLVALAADLVDGAITIASPVIVRRPLIPPVGLAYVFSDIGSAEAAAFIGSQNTRKPGRGS